MTDPAIRLKILEHLADPLKPSSQESLGTAAELVEFPTINRQSKGGLSPKGEALGILDPEIAEAAKNHKEQTRVKIHAVMATCKYFINEKMKTASPGGREALKAGITILTLGKPDQIKTTRKNEKLLTEEFKEMMGDLYRAISKTQPEEAAVLRTGVALQKKEEAIEKSGREGITEMA